MNMTTKKTTSEVTGKEVTLYDKIVEKGLQDQLPKEVEFDEEEDPVRKLPVILFVDGSKKSNLMITDIESKEHLKVVTKETLGKDVSKSVAAKLKSEKKLGNVYHIAYLPYTNDDLNKEHGKLRIELDSIKASIVQELQINTEILAYFSDHEDQAIAKLLT